MCLELPPERRAELARLVEAELRQAYENARAAGTDPAALAALIDERRRALAATTDAGGPADPTPDPTAGPTTDPPPQPSGPAPRPPGP